MALAKSIRFLPNSLLQIQVMELPTEMAVLGMLRIIYLSEPMVSSILEMIDPPPNTSIFGMDIQRGCMLSRYRGARPRLHDALRQWGGVGRFGHRLLRL